MAAALEYGLSRRLTDPSGLRPVRRRAGWACLQPPSFRTGPAASRPRGSRATSKPVSLKTGTTTSFITEPPALAHRQRVSIRAASQLPPPT